MGFDLDDYRRALGSLKLPRFAVRPAGSPFIVAIEGSNGAGKTTLCQLLAPTLNIPYCLGTDAAWFTDAFKLRMIRDADWFASAMFFLSGCCEQMRQVRARTDRLVIMDRSLWSTLAVQAAESPERLEALIGMLRPIAPLVQIPQLTVVLAASFETCQKRIAKKAASDRVLDELTARIGFHAREQAFYHWLLGQVPNLEFVEVDELKPEEVAKKVLALCRKYQC